MDRRLEVLDWQRTPMGPPDEPLLTVLGETFEDTTGQVVTFSNPLTGGESVCTVHLARRPRQAGSGH